MASVNGIYMIYSVFYIPSTLFVHHPISQKYGTRGVIIAAVALNVLSLWLRLGITGSSPYATAFFSNLFNAIALPLLINEIPRMVPQWFPSEEVLAHLSLDSIPELQQSQFWLYLLE